MLQTPINGSTEYHVQASETVLNLVQKNLISVDLFVQTFLQTVISSIDNRDPAVASAWLETLLSITELLPLNVIQSEICPIVLSRSQMTNPVSVRISSCRLIGAIAKCCDDVQVVKKVLLPTVISLCQDVNAEVRASMCINLEPVVFKLGNELTKSNLLPCIIELASDEAPKVKESSISAIAGMLGTFSSDMLEAILPLIKQIIIHAFNSDGSLIVTVANEYGKLCLGLKRALQFREKEKFVFWFSTLAKMGVNSGRRNEKGIFENISLYNPSTSEYSVLCHQYCAANFASMADFCRSDSDGELIAILHPILGNLCTNPYFMVRKTAAAGLHEITSVYGDQCGLIVPELLTILKDETEEVLEGIVPNLSSIIKHLVAAKMYKPGIMDSNMMELSGALMRCEHNLTLSHNWRTQSRFYKELQILPFVFSSDFNFINYVPLLFKRLHSIRAIPVRIAVVETLCAFLKVLEKSEHRSNIRSHIIKELCESNNFYDRMLYLKVCPNILEIFSTSYFKEYFFLNTCQLVDDPVPNIRLALCRLLPFLKTMIKLPDDEKLSSLLDTTVLKLSEDSDKEVLRQLHKFKEECGKYDFTTMFPNDKKKADEENFTRNDGLDKRLQSKPSQIPQSKHPGGVRATAVSKPLGSVASGPKSASPLSSKKLDVDSADLEPASAPGSLEVLSDKEFFVDTGLNLPPFKKQTPRVFQEPTYGRTSDSEPNSPSPVRKEPKEKPKNISPSKGIPVRKLANNQSPVKNINIIRRNLESGTKGHNKRHSLEVTDFNQNHTMDEKSRYQGSQDNEKAPSGRPQLRRQSHLPRPLSCVNFPVKQGESTKSRPISRLPVSNRLTEAQNHQKT